MRFSITTIIATLALSINAMPAQSEPAAMVNRDVSSSELAQMMRGEFVLIPTSLFFFFFFHKGPV